MRIVKKCLLIRKKLGLMSVVLDEIEFRFLELLGGFLLIFMVFDDMGYDKGYWMDEIVILVDFVGGLRDWGRLDFEVGV